MESNTALAEKFGDVEMFRTCEQCGRCSSACPITDTRDFNIRRIIRHIELDLIDKIAQTPLPWYCTTCGRCETVCPNGIAILDIIRPLRAMVPQDYIPEGPPPCMEACPAEIDIPGYLRLIAQRKPEEAYALILEKVPFPGILGRVCMHPCETECIRGEVNESISICALKRYAADKGGAKFERDRNIKDSTGHKVAIIGSGPAGLTAAYYLRKQGHDVTIFEAQNVAGGMLTMGIPEYRLPRDILETEIDDIKRLGVEIMLNSPIGVDGLSMDDLKVQGYEAVFIATGAHKSATLGIPNEGVEGIVSGTSWLKDINMGKDVKVGEKVVVIGGGNVAIDSARMALRLGAKEVTIAYRRSADEMPAIKDEIEAAEKEGIIFKFHSSPCQVVCEGDECVGLECLATELGEPDESGRRRPITVQGSEFVIDADMVISAIGEVPDVSFLDKGKFNISSNNRIQVNPNTMATNVDEVFAGGDVVTG